MNAKIIQMLFQQLFSKKGRKRLLIVVGFLFFLLFLPVIIVTTINPFSPFQGKNAANDPYINAYKQILSEKKITVDINIERAIDKVLFDDSIDNQSAVYDRANKYLYTEKKIVKKEKVYDEKTKSYKEVEKTYIVYIPNTLDQALAIVKNDVNVSKENIDAIDELYQYCLLDSETGGGTGTGSIGNISVPPITKNTQQFIDVVKDGAKKTYSEYGVFPSISLAQAILESGSGDSSLSQKYNNLFGIKADSSWTGQKVNLPTKEDYGGAVVIINADFRVYNNWSDSIEDHGKFLKENSTYSEHGVFTASDYVGQANALQAAGYATDPTYAAQLIGIIKEYNLAQYDVQ